MSDERTVVGDYSFPAGAEPDEELLYRIPFGDSKVEDLKWEGYVDVAHQLGAQGVTTELIESVEDDAGIKSAVVRVTVTDSDGHEWSNIGSADETTNQVRDPEFVWVVAASRAIKRSIKTAFNIKPVKDSASDEPAPTGSVDRGPDIPDGVELDDGHALADNAGGREETGVEGEVDW